MTEATVRDYWISPDALHIELNATGNPDYIQASCTSGAKILVFMKGIIDYDAGHNYRRWTLQASPTVFNSSTAKYVYAAIPRSDAADKPAFIVFPSQRIDIYGKSVAGAQIGSEDYYYVFLQGIISSGSQYTQQREWMNDSEGYHFIQTGYLASDEVIDAGPTDTEWYSYSTVGKVVTFLKNLTMKAGTQFYQLFARTLTLTQGGSVNFEGQEGTITGIAGEKTELTSEEDIVTPKFMDDSTLSKKHDDETAFNLTMRNLRVNGKADVFGNTVLHGGLYVGSAAAHADARIYGDLAVGNYNKGVDGAHVDFYGNAEFDSIVARSFVEFPEIRYNRTTITVGNRWQTQGAGLIEQVWHGADAPALSEYEGIAMLKLEEGEIGAIAEDDKCQGVYHFKDRKNAASTTDTKDGNYTFAGFTTIYFLIKEVYTSATLPSYIKEKLADGTEPADRQFFRYELRAATCSALPAEDRDRWTDSSHPQPMMSFACYANASDKNRQASRLSTTTYNLHLGGMTGWTYTQANIRLITGYLDGFSVLAKVWNKETRKFEQAPKEFHGEGIAVGNIYMWGTIDQFDRAPSVMTQHLYFRATTGPDAPDGIKVNASHSDYNLNGWQSTPLTPSAERRFVWQQWLYAYSDESYSVGDVTFHAADSTATQVLLDKNIVSVAVSDVYDTDAPDEITFDVTARAVAGTETLRITDGTLKLNGADENVKLSFVSEAGLSSMNMLFHVTLSGFVSVSVEGATPEDTFLTVNLETEYGAASAVLTIVQNREGEDGADGEKGEQGAQGLPGKDGADGQPGKDGQDAVSMQLSTPVVAVPTEDGSVTEGAAEREVEVKMYSGVAELQLLKVSSDWLTDTPFAVSISGATVTVIPKAGQQWTDRTIFLTATARDADGNLHERKAALSIIGSAQGQTVIGPQGASISKIEEYYIATAVNSAPEAADDGWQAEHMEPTADLPYVWNREVVYISDPLKGGDSVLSTDIHLCCTFSDGLLTHTSEYAVTSERTEPDTWGTLEEAMASFSARGNRYMWNRETVTYKDKKRNRVSVRLIAVWGEQGTPGKDAVSVSVSATAIMAHQADKEQEFLVKVRMSRGTELMVHGQDFECSALSPHAEISAGLTWAHATEDDGTTYVYRLTLAAMAIVNNAVPFTVTDLDSGIAYPYTLSFATSTDGERGYDGVSVRRSEWAAGTYYRNDTEEGAEAPDGNRYLDEVSVTDLATGTAKWYLAKAAHNGLLSDDGNRPVSGGNDYWEPINDMRPLRTSYADIMNAFIQYLQVNRILLTDADTQKPYGAFGAGQLFPLWFGGTTADNAVFKVDKEGRPQMATVGYNLMQPDGIDNALTNANVPAFFLADSDEEQLAAVQYLTLESSVYVINPTINYFEQYGELSDNLVFCIPAAAEIGKINLEIYIFNPSIINGYRDDKGNVRYPNIYICQGRVEGTNYIKERGFYNCKTKDCSMELYNSSSPVSDNRRICDSCGVVRLIGTKYFYNDAPMFGTEIEYGYLQLRPYIEKDYNAFAHLPRYVRLLSDGKHWHLVDYQY